MRIFYGIFISFLCFYSASLFASVPNDKEALHLEWLDKTINPHQNFFGFANGGWQKQNPIPAAYAHWDLFSILQTKNLELIHHILEAAAQNPHDAPGSIQQKVGDFYFSGMNEAAINKQGLSPLQPQFDAINKIQNLADLQKTITQLQMIGVDALFSFGEMQDLQDSNKVIGVASQSGLGLPDRDYYLKDDADSKKIRNAYEAHVVRIFQLLGDGKNHSVTQAKKIMKIETALAKASMTRIELRDPHAIYHLMSLAQIEKVTPNFAWKQYFSDMGHPEIDSLNLATPGFFKAMNNELINVSLEDWKSYLRIHLIQATAPFLSKPFVEENFRMASTLSGVKKLLPRWQRVTNAEEAVLGFAVGKLYVEKTFPPSSKIAVKKLIADIRREMQKDLETLTWMSETTRAAALKKLAKMDDRVGYPDKWLDYSPLTIDRGSYVLNVLRASEFLNKREWNKIGKPLDKTEWEMTPQTVNAYYDAQTNRLNIPAGILQPPFYDPKASEAINYGAIGFVIGHEMTHGFDDQGGQFDSDGNLNNWWTREDLKKFQLATQCIENQYSQYKVLEKVNLKGKLVKGEAASDLGGLILAYRAFHSSSNYQDAKTLAGFTPDQQFFLSAAHMWAANIRPEHQLRMAMMDPHPPAIYRINGTFANMPEFRKAYGILDALEKKLSSCVIW